MLDASLLERIDQFSRELRTRRQRHPAAFVPRQQLAKELDLAAEELLALREEINEQSTVLAAAHEQFLGPQWYAQELLECLSDTCIETDINGIVIYANGAAVTLTKRKYLVDFPVIRIFARDAQDHALSRMRQVARRHPPLHWQAQLERPGELRWVHVFLHPIEAHGHRPPKTALRWFIRDIGAEKLLENKLLDLQDTLHSQQADSRRQLEAKERDLRQALDHIKELKRQFADAAPATIVATAAADSADAADVAITPQPNGCSTASALDAT